MKSTLYISVIFIFIVSCTRKDPIKKTYFFDENNSLEISIKNIECKFIPLETTNECLFNDVHTIEINNDTIFLITKKYRSIFAFDIKGNFIGEIGKIGNGPGEQLRPSSFHINRKNNEIIIADMSKQSLLYYDLTNFQYKYSKKSFMFFNCCWLPDGNIAWVYHGYKGEKRNYYNVKITDNNIQEIARLNDTKFSPQYIITLGNMIYKYNNNHYLNLPNEPTIYKITSKSVEPVFTVDFGKYKFASKEWLCHNAMDHYYSTISKTDYISACNIQETKNYIGASFLYKGNNIYTAFYNKKKNISCIIQGNDFIDKSGLIGISPIKGTDGDYFISLIYPATLKNKKIKRKDLLDFSKQISEDDNPIICLFRFKNQSI